MEDSDCSRGFCSGEWLLVLYAAVAQVLIQPVSEETIDESVESLYELWFTVLLVRYRCYRLTYIELIF